ncbi:MAG: SRPBCC domain-containing protein, partial [Planctomycetales bacterium]|nr:SRPBCC domain-containing protein [Planctomycetales bacterium]
MKYMLLIYGAETCWTEEERRECMQESLELCEELATQGKFVAASPLHSVVTATTLRIRDGKRQITDGPFAETAEQLGGYYIIEAQNLDEAIDIASRVPPAKVGSVEIRPIFDMSGLEESKDDRTFLSARTIPYSRNEVFRAFATPEVLAKWWGPDGFTNTFHEFDFRPGGSWRFIMHGPDGKNYDNESIFKQIVAPELVQIEHVCEPHFVLTITLAALSPSETRVVWRM